MERLPDAGAHPDGAPVRAMVTALATTAGQGATVEIQATLTALGQHPNTITVLRFLGKRNMRKPPEGEWRMVARLSAHSGATRELCDRLFALADAKTNLGGVKVQRDGAPMDSLVRQLRAVRFQNN